MGEVVRLSEDLMEGLRRLAEINDVGGIEQETYVMQEFAEFLKAYTDEKRGHLTEVGHQAKDEAKDLLCALLVYMLRKGEDLDVVFNGDIQKKVDRAINEYEKEGLL